MGNRVEDPSPHLIDVTPTHCQIKHEHDETTKPAKAQDTRGSDRNEIQRIYTRPHIIFEYIYRKKSFPSSLHILEACGKNINLKKEHQVTDREDRVKLKFKCLSAFGFHNNVPAGKVRDGQQTVEEKTRGRHANQGKVNQNQKG